MNKKLCKIISAALLGVSLCTIGIVIMPSQSVQASIEEDGLKNQCIYQEGDYIIAKENASYKALIQSVYLEISGIDGTSFYVYYSAPSKVGSKTYEDGTTITAEENDEGYLLTYKIPKSLLPALNKVKVKFETPSFGANIYPHYVDDNGGQYYSL